MDLLFITVVILLCMCIYGLYRKSVNGICKSKNRLDGKTCIVTGGTSGLGLEIAIDFASRGARVIVACPFEDEGNNAKRKIIEESNNENVEYKYLDLASLESVRKFANKIKENERRLDILVNNAGVGVTNKITVDGMNTTMQVNYFGHFLLTILLLTLMKKTGQASAPSRIVNTTSILHAFAKLDVNNLNYSTKCIFKQVGVYGNSKYCLMLFSTELARRLSGANVVINNAEPGEVGTRIYLSAGYIIGAPLSLFCLLFSKTPFEGAQTAIHAAIDDKAGTASGKCFRDCESRSWYKTKPLPNNKQRVIAEALWNESVALVKLSNEELDECLGN